MSSKIGTQGEKLAADYLKDHGYEVVEQNWRCRWGEIDIIAKQAVIWVFCEVKTRHSASTQAALINITPRKRQKMIAAAQHYLYEHHLEDVMWRIDAIGIAIPRNGKALIDHVEDVLDW